MAYSYFYIDRRLSTAQLELDVSKSTPLITDKHQFQDNH